MKANPNLRLSGNPLYTELLEVVERYEAASSERLETAALVDARYDRKFIVSRHQAVAALMACASNYQVALAGQRRVAQYDTMYFDTRGLDLYHDHRRGKLPRHKVRIRTHVDRNLSFLEVKTKTARGETTKERSVRANMNLVLDDTDRATLHRLFPTMEFVVAAQTVFRRLTLVGTAERITMDFELGLIRAGKSLFTERAVIVEVKAQTRDTPSALLDRLSNHANARIPGCSISKYCAAIALLSQEQRNPDWTPGFSLL